jgi:GMP synthase-like glutamine amidotransferase
MKNKRIAIIDNAMDHSVYTPVKHWHKHLPFEGEAFRAPAGDFPDLRDGYTHLILTGSEASIMERESWVGDEVALVHMAVDRGVAILGSCWGHQLLALALSGPENVRRCDEPEIGWLPIQVLRDNSLLGKKGRIHVCTVHFDEVVGLSGDFSILASTPKCGIHAFQWKGRPVWGVQSHPEIDIPDGRELFRNFLSRESPAAPLFQATLASPARDSGAIRGIVSAFLGA